MQWYYVENGQQAGPVEDDVLASLVRGGRIDPQTLIWNATMANWEPYGQVMARLSGGGGAPVAGAGGVATQANAAYCVECGRAFPTEDMILYSGSYVCAECKPLFFQKIKEGIHVGGNFQYAGFWIRAGARIIDLIVLMIVIIPLDLLLGAGRLLSLNGNPQLFVAAMSIKGSLLWTCNLLITISYFTYFTGRSGQTPGKKACGIRVVRSDANQITYPRALGRYGVEVAFTLIPILGVFLNLINYLMVAFDDQKRALHDRICETRVVYWTKR